jgi:CelD/BcsL family acetyltransferase involved in cellulose biosynthesis
MTNFAHVHGKSPEFSASVISPQDATAIWGTFEDSDPFGVAQMLPWVRGWQDCVNPDVFVATLSVGTEPLLLLPLEIVRYKGITIARYVGGSHANANFPVLKSASASKVTAVAVQLLFSAIKSGRPEVDALVLTRQMQDFAGIANPLLCFGSSESPNLSLSFKLASDFEALAKERGWSRKQKKMRNQARRLQDRGGWTCVKSDNPEAALRLMDAFLVLKAARFKEFGQRNTFEDESVKNFFRKLFVKASQSDRPEFQLDALDVNGELLAVSGSVIKHGTIVVEFGAVDGTETSLSPGDFLYHQMIQRSCAEGLEYFDFGVGDEPYKRSWCDIETHHRDSTYAFTPKGQAYVAAFRLAVAAKRAVKRNRLLFGLVKKWRERNAGAPAKADAE